MYRHSESVMPLAVVASMFGLALNSCLKARTEMIATVITQLLSFVSFRWVTQVNHLGSLSFVSPHCKSNTEAKRNCFTDRARWLKSCAQKNKNTMRENKLDPSQHALALWQVQVKPTWEVNSTAWAGATVTVRVCGTKQGQTQDTSSSTLFHVPVSRRAKQGNVFYAPAVVNGAEVPRRMSVRDLPFITLCWLKLQTLSHVSS